MPTRRLSPAAATADLLEPRRLFAATLEATRTLVITSTAGDDVIFVDLEIGVFGERTLRVVENDGVSGTFAEGDVDDILVQAGDGNDFVRIGSGGFAGSVRAPAQVDGGNGNDEINGGRGGDSLVGGPGDDFITGYAGNDFVDGGEGNDTIIVHIGLDTVFGGPGDDQLNGKETGRSSTFDGGDGNDQITGTSRRDTIRGGAGNDTIDGGRGADRVFAGDGEDRITINTKSARLRGEAGADVFLTTGNKGRGSIKDFVEGEDSIQPAPPATPVTPPLQAAIVSNDVRDHVAELLG